MYVTHKMFALLQSGSNMQLDMGFLNFLKMNNNSWFFIIDTLGGEGDNRLNILVILCIPLFKEEGSMKPCFLNSVHAQGFIVYRN